MPVLTLETPNHSGDTLSLRASNFLVLRPFLANQALPPRRKTRLKFRALSSSLSSRKRTHPPSHISICLRFKPCRQYTSQRAVWSSCYNASSRTRHPVQTWSPPGSWKNVLPALLLHWRKFSEAPSRLVMCHQTGETQTSRQCFKKSRPDDPANYRPISLTSIASKLLEHIVHKAVVDHLDNLHLLSNVQHDLRKERSCETKLSAVVQDIACLLGLSQQVDAIILDLTKAFDTVPHHRLFYKLSQYGIRDNTP